MRIFTLNSPTSKYIYTSLCLYGSEKRGKKNYYRQLKCLPIGQSIKTNKKEYENFINAIIT